MKDATATGRSKRLMIVIDGLKLKKTCRVAKEKGKREG
jgi:hypothetical protein